MITFVIQTESSPIHINVRPEIGHYSYHLLHDFTPISIYFLYWLYSFHSPSDSDSPCTGTWCPQNTLQLHDSFPSTQPLCSCWCWTRHFSIFPAHTTLPLYLHRILPFAIDWEGLLIKCRYNLIGAAVSASLQPNSPPQPRVRSRCSLPSSVGHPGHPCRLRPWPR